MFKKTNTAPVHSLVNNCISYPPSTSTTTNNYNKRDSNNYSSKKVLAKTDSRVRKHNSLVQSMESLLSRTAAVITNTIASAGKETDTLWNVAGKTCIVTGATSGIGVQTALALVKRGARVILGCRNGQAAEEAIIFIRRHAGLKTPEQAAKQLSWSHLDLASMQSVRRFADEIILNEPRLHVLVNNAAVLTGRERQVRLEGNMELTFATNHLGPFLLTNLLLPLMKKSTPSRIIVVSSDCYKMCRKADGINLNDPFYDFNPKDFDPWVAYCQTKLANIHFARTLNWKLNGGGHSGVSVFTVNPGLTRTNLYRNQSRGFKLIFGQMFGRFGKSSKDGAETVIYCATQPGMSDFSGRYLSKRRVKTLEPFAMDDIFASKLWLLCERLSALGEVVLANNKEAEQRIRHTLEPQKSALPLSSPTTEIPPTLVKRSESSSAILLTSAVGITDIQETLEDVSDQSIGYSNPPSEDETPRSSTSWRRNIKLLW